MEKEKLTVAVTGATGGIGNKLCFALAERGVNLVLLTRSREKAEALSSALLSRFPSVKVDFFPVDFTSPESVFSAVKNLKNVLFDALILGAGTINAPRDKTAFGFDPVFTVNFLAQYAFCRRLLESGHPAKKIVAVGSIAYAYAKFSPADPDYSSIKRATAVYANAKRCLTAAFSGLPALFPGVSFLLAHPGITLTDLSLSSTNIVRSVARAGLKLLFPSPKKACRSVLAALNAPYVPNTWIGPRVLGVYGKPKVKKLKTGKDFPVILAFAETAYQSLSPFFKD